jgi:hypothetical protein
LGPIARAQNWLEAPIPDVGEHTGNLVERCRKHERPRHEPAFSGPAYLLQPYCSRCSCRGRSYPRAYCNRADTSWYATDTRLALARRKPPEQAKLPDAPGRARTHSSKLVKRLGQRFESARRLFVLPANIVKVKSPRHEHRGLCQQYISSRLYPKASSILSAACLPMLGIQCEWRSRVSWMEMCPNDR